jgi:hypothetical protein
MRGKQQESNRKILLIRFAHPWLKTMGYRGLRMTPPGGGSHEAAPRPGPSLTENTRSFRMTICGARILGRALLISATATL